MSINDVRISCLDCGFELKSNDDQCPSCGSIKKAKTKEISEELQLRSGLNSKQKRKGYKRPIREIVKRVKTSKDSKSPKLVQEERIIDREKGEYHQVVQDDSSGNIIHEEHPHLKDHKT
jgi:hypothetical protein